MTALDAGELDRLEALAEKALAADFDYVSWHNADYLRCFIDGDDAQVFSDADTAFIAACDPATVRRLVAAAREPLDVDRLATVMEDHAFDLDCGGHCAPQIAREYAALRKPVTA